MKSFASHLADCRTIVDMRTPVTVPLAECEGLELAEQIVARSPFPAFAASAMDGYAIRVADVPGRLRVAGEVAAGHVPDVTVEPGVAVRIMTGGAIPTGTEAVVPVEDTSERDGVVQVGVATSAGHFIRWAGEDVKVGDVVLDAGRLIGPGQVAALAAHGRTEVRVWPRPRVAVISTGDELVGTGGTPGPAQLRDSNGPGLAAAARACGAQVVQVQQASDEPDELIAALDALPDVDLIVTSGGVSMGTHDVVKAALADLGVTFEPVAMQPGKPQGWGRFRGRTAFLGLPGNPVSALICFEVFGRAALRRERPVASAVLLEDITGSPVGKVQLLRGSLQDGTVRLVSGPGSHLVAGLAQANCLVVVDEQASSLTAGSVVPVMLL